MKTSFSKKIFYPTIAIIALFMLGLISIQQKMEREMKFNALASKLNAYNELIHLAYEKGDLSEINTLLPPELRITIIESEGKVLNDTKVAHPADGGGQGLIKHIHEVAKRPEFRGKILFLENYDIRVAQRLIAGVDVWLNTPTRPLEASGTSGMKAVMNGALNLSVLDGWWYEGYVEGGGWAITDKRTYQDQNLQDELALLRLTKNP